MTMFLKTNAGLTLNNAANNANRIIIPAQAPAQHVNYRMYEDAPAAQPATFNPRLERLAPQAAEQAD